jgi:pimeloyl-ACP methyl ester carboxylesterase
VNQRRPEGMLGYLLRRSSRISGFFKLSRVADPFARRYWRSLIDAPARSEEPYERRSAGISLWRRYWASLLGVRFSRRSAPNKDQDLAQNGHTDSVRDIQPKTQQAPASVPMQKSQALGRTVPLYARDTGQGIPLVLLHDYPLSSAMWLAQRESLSKRLRVLTPDLRGFGGSVLSDDDPSIDLMADDVAALIRAKGIDKAIIGGLGMGGYVAMAMCRRQGDLLLGVVLANTQANADAPEVQAARLQTADRIEADDSVHPLVEELLPRMVGPTTFRQRALVYGRVRGLVQSAPPRGAAWAQRAMANRPDSFEALRAMTVPALVITSAEDEITTMDDAQAMVDALPEAVLMVIPRAGHLSAVEQPELFNQAIDQFTTIQTRIG